MRAATRDRLLAVGFVTLYGAGFVGARLGLPHAEPFAFLALRFALAAGLLAVIALALGQPWPQGPRRALHIIGAGLLSVGVFSAGVFYSIAGGLPPALSALIIALHPILVAVLAPALLGERVSGRQWIGLLLGLLGVFIVLQHGLNDQPTLGLPVLYSFIGLVGLTTGNLYQKARCADMPLFTGGALQCATCATACALGAVAYETGDVRWTGEFIVALVWMAILVSVGAVSLLYQLIRHGEVSRIASLFYLVPVSAALTA
ncbi:MAG: DMT family transporter [Azonexus sp.]|jgi:drug/metabolite transporter (DMT)-like permease|nr:DMT family transporter [Azonexus sp.]